MNITIRSAEPSDAESIEKIRKKVWLSTYPNKSDMTVYDILSRFVNIDEKLAETKSIIKNQKRFRYWLAEVEEVVVGFVGVNLRKEINIIDSLYILKPFQGKGVGSKLMDKVLAFFKSGDVLLRVASSNSKAIKFYENKGFKTDMGIEANDFVLPTGKRIEVIWMRKINQLS